MSVMYIRNARTGKFEPVKAILGEKGEPGTVENVTITSISGLPEALDEKLGMNEQAADSAKLGGVDASQYATQVYVSSFVTSAVQNFATRDDVSTAITEALNAIQNASGVSF